jgi:hypothetical protein
MLFNEGRALVGIAIGLCFDNDGKSEQQREKQ